jgi:hypothetical protein
MAFLNSSSAVVALQLEPVRNSGSGAFHSAYARARMGVTSFERLLL